MKVFLTGTTGFVGAVLLNRLIEDQVDVTAMVRNKSIVLPYGVNQVVTDLSNLSDVDAGFLNGVDVVVHTAARVHIMQEQAVDPLVEYRKVNRDATLVLARLAAEAGVKRFVFVSSIKVNGEMTRPGHFYMPNDTFIPNDPYGLSKYEAEQGLLALSKETKMEVVIIRPPLVYGPNVKGNFASMVNWIKKGIPLPLGVVHNQRSLVALDNLVDFIALCTDRERSPNAANKVFLISDGEDVSTSELLRKVARAYGVKSRLLPIPVGLMRFVAKILGKGAVADRLFGSLQVDSSKARDLLGWKPVTTMDEQLQKTAQAYLSEKHQ
jgi:nucleoside-diphosphate-sugar epimerase